MCFVLKAQLCPILDAVIFSAGNFYKDDRESMYALGDRPGQTLKRGSFKAILWGETGSGKSTLINYSANFFLEGSVVDLKIVIPTKYLNATESSSNSSEMNVHDSTVSKTVDWYTFEKTKWCYREHDSCPLFRTVLSSLYYCSINYLVIV